MNGHIQICQQNNLQELKSTDIESDLAIRTYFDEDFPEINLNVSFGVYESNNVHLYDRCQKYNYEPADRIKESDSYGRSIDIKTIQYNQKV